METNLKIILKEKDRRVSFLVRNTGISRYSLDKIVKGEKSPTIEEMIRIAKSLNEPLNKIFFNINTDTFKSKINTDKDKEPEKAH